MKNFIYSFLAVLTFVICLYGCSEEGSSIPTSNNTSTNQVPNKPKNPYPADSSVNVDTNNVMVLSWQCTDPDAGDILTFDIYAGNTLPLSNTPIATNISNPSYGLGILQASTNYYWKVTAKDNHGGSNTGNVWRFRTVERR